MGRIANEILKNLEFLKKKKIIDLSEFKERKSVLAEQETVHSAYVAAQNLLSVFAEQISDHPAMNDYHKLMITAEELYMPSAPPISPITKSFFTFWAFLDASFGSDKETVAGILQCLGSELGVHSDYLDTIVKLRQSRMGIYEHVGFEGELIQFKELMTEKVYLVKCISGYKGKIGELWYVRLGSPLGNYCDYHITLTTPYVLIIQTKEDWMNYFKRNKIEKKYLAHEKMLRIHMKTVTKDPFFWTEFVFEAYSNHQSDMILLTGLPDRPKTRPHSKSYQADVGYSHF